MKNYIERLDYINRVLPYVNKELIKVFVGQRRVGKSYLLYQIMDHLQKQFDDPQVIYINKELNEFDHIRNYQDLYSFVNEHHQEHQTTHLFIDEIQNIEGFENALRSFVAE